MAAFQTLPGFRDFYPEDFGKRQRIFQGWRKSAEAYGFQEYDAPVLEPLDLYRAKSGEEVEGQLFNFEDKGGRAVALRPEMTPSVCRMVGEKASALRRPIKWFSIAEFYRYERMQKGRGRSFSQLNADIFGEPGVEAEIELIALLAQCLRGFGLTEEDFRIRLSDRDLWLGYLESLGLDAERAQSMLVVIDKHEKLGETAFSAYEQKFGAVDASLKDRIAAFLQIKSFAALESAVTSGIGGGAPRLASRLADWRRLLDGLAAMKLDRLIEVDLGVVRGLAYYTGFVFEAFDRKGDLRAIAGGGRYNNLVGKLGYKDLPAAGFAMGDMTFSLLLEQRGLAHEARTGVDVYCVIGGEPERACAFADIQALRAAGRRVEYPFHETPFAKQFKAAAESGARLALIYGSDERAKGVVKLRDMRDRSERDVSATGVAQAVEEMLGR